MGGQRLIWVEAGDGLAGGGWWNDGTVLRELYARNSAAMSDQRVGDPRELSILRERPKLVTEEASSWCMNRTL